MSGQSASSAVNRVQVAGALITAKLDVRSRRLPDYAAENEALHALARALTASETAMLQKLVDTAWHCVGLAALVSACAMRMRRNRRSGGLPALGVVRPWRDISLRPTTAQVASQLH